MEENQYWQGFSVFPGVGPVSFQKLLTHFGSAKAAWLADENDLTSCLGKKRSQDFCAFREAFSFDSYRKNLEKKQVSVITLQDKTYPALLKQIDKPPFILYVKGDLDNLQCKKTISIVGTRKITQYGADVTKLFAQELVAYGCCIISGLAMGVDAIAHKTAITSMGKTIAVLGCGVDCCNPRENQQLYDEILASGGTVISEVPLGMSPTIGTFPARNRIVAGMSAGILVTEGAEDSGALITADFGFSYNRSVFAVPGPITSSLSKGPYKLIEKGARLVTKPGDVLKELKITNDQLRIKTNEKIIGDTKEEQQIIDLLENESLSFDELVRMTKLDSAKLASIISLMELKGILTSTSNSLISLAV